MQAREGRLLHWNGRDVPEELRDLPAGTYVIEPDEPPLLSADETEGLKRALAALRGGAGSSLEQVRARIDAILQK